ncbi:MAG TPA: MFS transporter [Streptosporangiaceae bacterium]
MQPATQTVAAPTPSRADARRVAKAGFLGTTIEWYDFYLYANTATLVFGKEFFPALSPTTAVLASFATISVAFVARPIGGVIFAHFGDRIGRKATLVTSLLMMGVSTMLVGVLPTYAQIGVAAPILLTVLRFLQGVAVGGEWGGAVLMATEFAPPGERARMSGWPQQGVTAGLALSTALLLLVNLVVPRQAYLDWGWRLTFLVSAVLVAVGLVLRLRMKESPAFEATRTKVRGLPIVAVFRESPRVLVLAVLTYLAVSVCFYIPFTYLLSHATEALKIAQPAALIGVLVAAAVYAVGQRIAVGLADRYGRRLPLLLGAGGSIVMAVPMVALTETGSPVWWAVGLALYVFPVGLLYAPVGVYFAELFPTAVRYSGTTAANQLGSVIGGGLAPFIAVGLASGFGMYGVAAYLIVIAVISGAAVLRLGETRHVDITR